MHLPAGGGSPARTAMVGNTSTSSAMAVVRTPHEAGLEGTWIISGTRTTRSKFDFFSHSPCLHAAAPVKPSQFTAEGSPSAEVVCSALSQVVALFARSMLALLEECNPGASNNRAFTWSA